MRTIDWADGHIVAIDQNRLPAALELVELESVDQLIDAVRRLAIRGAPALGVAGALGVALAAIEFADLSAARAAADRLRSARPTAVNLAWGVDRVLPLLALGADAALAEAMAVLHEDVICNKALSERGAQWLIDTLGEDVRVQTHCNAGALACVEWGTALGVVRALHERAALAHVYASETRPLLQGARLTAWELAQLGIPHTLVTDSGAASVVARGLASVVIVGADRITANGDVINKVGTYPLALAADRAGTPFVVAAPESTIDVATPSGADVEIEMRDGDEIVNWSGRQVAPTGTATLNFAFDVTPASLVTVIVTERRLVFPTRGERPDA